MLKAAAARQPIGVFPVSLLPFFLLLLTLCCTQATRADSAAGDPVGQPQALGSGPHRHARSAKHALGSAATDPDIGSDGGDEIADYVIIGGGTAGSVLAARLCEALPDTTFTLLERGAPRPRDSELRVRAMRHAYTSWKDPALTQTWMSQENPALLGREVSVLSGQTLGGSSSIAGGQWTKPPLRIFDTDLWGFAGLTPAKAAELYSRVERHLGVAAPPPELSQTHLHPYLQAATAAGIPVRLEPPARTKVADSIWPNAVTADPAGRRRDAYTAYVAPVIGRSGVCALNLKIIQPAIVKRVVIDGGRAVAVEFLRADAPQGQQERTVRAGVEVICSAGPYGSPQLLQLSGIGPAALLAKHGISLVADLPVGANSLARPRAGLVDVYTTAFAPENDGANVNSPESLAQFHAGRGGVYGVPVAATNGILSAQHAYTFSTNTGAGVLRGMPLIHSVCAINPTARGSIAITSRDPTQPPLVHTNLQGTSEDRSHTLACLKRLQVVTEHLRPTLGLMSVVPGVDAVLNGAMVADTSDFVQHMVAGCAAGEVVDGAFRVRGVQGLRVVDASALPDMPPFAGPLATVYMIAELAAERIVAQAEQSCWAGGDGQCDRSG